MNKTHENKTQTQNAVTLWHFLLFFPIFFGGVKIVTLIDLVLFSNSFKGWFGGTCDQSKTRRFISSMVGSSSTSCHEAKQLFFCDDSESNHPSFSHSVFPPSL